MISVMSPAALLPAVTALLLLVVSCCCSTVPSPVVEVTGGAVQGAREQSARGRDYYAYRAVPYADFVEGEDRFERPRPVRPWHGNLSCVDHGPYCAQAGYGQQRGEENCQHLSVYTPKLPENGESPKLPVMMWLPGGAFIVSGAADYDPRLLMDKDLVLVVPQYRVGLLGFFYGFSDAFGNYGMLDQVAALRWVQENIAQFGGDPSSVTLGGDCAGGASALYHMIAPKSQGLFHRVVSVSGTPLSPWAKQPANRRTMLILSNYLECPKSAVGDMVDCFKTKDVETLLEAQMYLLEARDLFVGNGGLAPAVQTQAIKREEMQFLDEEPILPFLQGRFAQVPVLLITSKDVGNYVVDMSLYDWMLHKGEEKGDSFKDEMVSILIKEMGVKTGEEEEQQLWDQYLPGLRGASYEDKLPGVGQMLGDALYNTGLLHTARYLNDRVPTYLMRFDFEDGPHSFDKRHPDPATAPPIPAGAGHGDELSYFLPEQHQGFSSEQQRDVSQLMLDILDNFVSGRPPSADWPQFTDEGLESATITREGQLGQDRFLPLDRVKTSEMIYNSQHKVPLFKLEERRQKDEL